jgi:hypothetical protein
LNECGSCVSFVGRDGDRKILGQGHGPQSCSDRCRHRPAWSDSSSCPSFSCRLSPADRQGRIPPTFLTHAPTRPDLRNPAAHDRNP